MTTIENNFAIDGNLFVLNIIFLQAIIAKILDSRDATCHVWHIFKTILKNLSNEDGLKVFAKFYKDKTWFKSLSASYLK